MEPPPVLSCAPDWSVLLEKDRRYSGKNGHPKSDLLDAEYQEMIIEIVSQGCSTLTRSHLFGSCQEQPVERNLPVIAAAKALLADSRLVLAPHTEFT